MRGCCGPDITDFFIVSILGSCGGLERTDFLTVYTLGRCGVLEIFNSCVAKLKYLIFNSFYNLGGYAGSDRTDF